MGFQFLPTELLVLVTSPIENNLYGALLNEYYACWDWTVTRLFFVMGMGLHRSPVDSPHNVPVMWKVFPCHDVTICNVQQPKKTPCGMFSEIIDYDHTILIVLLRRWCHLELFAIPNERGTAGTILCMCPANGRRRYILTSSLIGWAHT